MKNNKKKILEKGENNEKNKHGFLGKKTNQTKNAKGNLHQEGIC